MNRRFSVRLSDELAQGIDALARRSGKTKSEVVRDALTSAGLGDSQSTPSLAAALRRAAALRARQTKVFDVVALVREGREGLDRRGSRPRKDPACRGRREPPGGRVTLASSGNDDDGEGGNRTHDTTIFSRVLYQLSYLAVADARVDRAVEG